MNTQLPTTSTVKLRGRGRKSSDNYIDKVTKRAKKAESNADDVKRQAKEAEQELAAFEAMYSSTVAKFESDTSVKMLLREKSNKEGDLKVNPACDAAYEAMGMEKISMSFGTTELRENKRVLRSNDLAALPGQKLTGSDLTASDLSQLEYNLTRSGFSGKWAGFKYGTARTTNDVGRVVNKNCHIVAKAKYKEQSNQGTGFAKHNQDKALNYDKLIPELCRKFPMFCKLLPNGEGFDILQLKDDFKRDLLAKFCHKKDFRSFQKMLVDKKGALGGMHSARITDNGDIVKIKGMPTALQNSGYRFMFNQDNKTRFDMS